MRRAPLRGRERRRYGATSGVAPASPRTSLSTLNAPWHPPGAAVSMPRRLPEQNKVKGYSLSVASKPDHPPDIRRRRAAPAQLAQARRLRRLRQLATVGVENEPVVMIGRLRQAEQRLQQAVDAGRPEQILPAHHVADTLQSVVHGNGEMIARRSVLAREHHVAPQLRRSGRRHRSGRADRGRFRSRSARRRAPRPRPWRAASRRARRRCGGALRSAAGIMRARPG